MVLLCWWLLTVVASLDNAKLKTEKVVTHWLEYNLVKSNILQILQTGTIFLLVQQIKQSNAVSNLNLSAKPIILKHVHL
jgi:hypothetical protein